MLPKADRILPGRLPALCRLLLDDVGIPSTLRTKVLESLFYWWERSTDQAIVQQLQVTIQLLAGSSVAREVAEGLLRYVDATDDLLASRTIELLSRFSSETEASVPILVKALTTRTGAGRWRAAATLAELGIEDEWIMMQFVREPGEAVSAQARMRETAHTFDQARFCSLYRSS